MSVFREMTIEWGGEEYAFTPSNKLMRRIEGELAPSSLIGVMQRTSEANPPISEISYIAAEFLKSAGVPDAPSEDDMFMEIMGDTQNNGGAWFAGFCEVLVMAITPPDTGVKKSKPQKKGQKKK